jgi:predicted RNase H-like nuclease (RuvC/YqgF family)
MGRTRSKEIKSEEENEQTIKELKAANRRLKSDNERLKAELSTLNAAFDKTSTYLKGNTDNISVEKIIDGVKKGSTLNQIKKQIKCEKCGSHNVKEFNVANVGTIVLCGDCKDRRVVKSGKNKEHEGY